MTGSPQCHERPEIAGADAVEAWFGKWPCFHDAEILELHLNRSGVSSLTLHVSHENKNPGLVTFRFLDIVNLQLRDFSCQNVIFDLEVEKTTEGHLLTLSPCFGLAGYVEAREMSVEMRPEKPELEETRP